MGALRFEIWKVVALCLFLCTLAQGARVFRSSTSSLGDNEVEVTTPLGSVVGQQGTGFAVFRGIPFALPANGTLRWAKPVAQPAWAPDRLDATQFGPACPQATNLTAISEDCLFVNVWMPYPPPSTPVPVMTWIYGGAFIDGFSHEISFYGDYFANTSNVVLVSLNYRLGVFGFLATDTLAGNYGIFDQVMAMQWVQANVASFGGDPARVTMFGQSAGAMSAAVHLTSPVMAKAPLFERAILESNPVVLEYRTAAETLTYAKSFASNLKCSVDDVACMQAASMDAVLAAQDVDFKLTLPFSTTSILTWKPTIDGDYIIDQPFNILSAGGGLNVPQMWGTVRNESLQFIPSTLPLDKFVFEAAVEYIFGLENAYFILQQYPLSDNDTEVLNQIEQLGTDYLWTCAIRYMTRGLADTRKIYNYYWDHVPSQHPLAKYPECDDAVCHSSEITFVFRSADLYPPAEDSFTPAEVQLSIANQALWADFAHDRLDPTVWAPYNQSISNTMHFVLPAPSTIYDLKNAICDFWDGIGYLY